MKRFCLISFLLISVFFFFSVKTGNAAPVIFDDTEYVAEAYVGSWDVDEDLELPVFASSSDDPNDPVYAEAGAYTNIDGLNDFYTFTTASSSEYALSEAFMDSRLEFEATFPVLHVQFNYSLSVGETADNVYAEIWFGLYNETGGDSGYWDTEDSYIGEDFSSGTFNISGSNPNSSLSGSFNQYLTLATPDDTYALYLELSSECEVTNGSTWTSVDVTNLQIDAVPIPATALLLGSGLIGLVGFRRKFRK